MRNKTTRNLTAKEKNMPYLILADPTKRFMPTLERKAQILLSWNNFSKL